MEEHIEANKYEQMLPDYVSGTLSESENKEVEQWIDESEENLKIARDIYAIYVASDAINTIQQLDAPLALGKVKKKIHRKKVKEVSLFTWMQRIAAVLFIPLMITLGYYMIRKEPVEYIEIRTNPGMVAKVNLPDGTNVWLNSDSYIRHPHKFTGKKREVEMEGEVYFEVQKDKSKQFIVHTPNDFSAEVLGTEFNIEAYKNTNLIRTTLVSGSVKLTYSNKENEKESRILSPSEDFIYNTRTKNAELTQSYIPTLTAWKDGKVILRRTPFEEVLRILGKRFNVDFIVKNVKLYDGTYNATIDGQHLSLILEFLRMSSGIQYRFIDPEPEENEYKIMEKTIVELY